MIKNNQLFRNRYLRFIRMIYQLKDYEFDSYMERAELLNAESLESLGRSRAMADDMQAMGGQIYHRLQTDDRKIFEMRDNVNQVRNAIARGNHSIAKINSPIHFGGWGPTVHEIDNGYEEQLMGVEERRARVATPVEDGDIDDALNGLDASLDIIRKQALRMGQKLDSQLGQLDALSREITAVDVKTRKITQKLRK